MARGANGGLSVMGCARSVAKEVSDALRYAVSVVPNFSLFEYEVEFTLRPAHDIAP